MPRMTPVLKTPVFLTLLITLVCLPLAAQDDETPKYVGRAFIFEADLERGVELGWLEAGYSVEEVMAEIKESINDRLLRTGRFVEGLPRTEEGSRLSVTIVGKQAKPLEDMLIGGIATAGRFSMHPLASDEDFAACGSTRDEESAKLDAWLAKQPDGRTSAFNLEPAPDGGPCEGIRWLDRWPADVEEHGAAVAVLEEPMHLVRNRDAESFELAKPSEETAGMELTLKEEALEALREFGAASGTRELAIAVDAEVIWTEANPGTWENPLVLQGRFGIDELRHMVMSFAAEPLPAPLEFVEMGRRDLPNVKIRDSPTAID